jgi:hypothetical protein
MTVVRGTSEESSWALGALTCPRMTQCLLDALGQCIDMTLRLDVIRWATMQDCSVFRRLCWPFFEHQPNGAKLTGIHAVLTSAMLSLYRLFQLGPDSNPAMHTPQNLSTPEPLASFHTDI